MTEKEYGDYLEYLGSFGIRPGLDNIKELCRRLGDPQDSLAFVHIAGTNAKGSVAALLESAFTACSINCGRYTSPAVTDYRERFTAGGRMISKKMLLELMDEVKGCCEKMYEEGLGHPTVFEAETALAFLFFARKKCDIVVLECGMGGLEDATNVVETTLMEVITPVGCDHMQFLGGSLEKIAYQKAGIIKPGSIAVTNNTDEKVLGVLKKACVEKGAELFVCEGSDISDVSPGLDKQKLTYKRKLRLTISLAGAYQIDNTHLAVEALMRLLEKAKDINGISDVGEKGSTPDVRQAALEKLAARLSPEGIKKGFLTARWPGRFEIVSRSPLFIADGAHNGPAAAALARSLKFYFSNHRIIYIMGVFQDKDTEQILKHMLPMASQVITVRLPDVKRSMEAVRLAEMIAERGVPATGADSVREAVEMALLLSGKDGVIVSFGSLSYLGEIRDIIAEGKDHGRSKKGAGSGKDAARGHR